MALPQNFVYVHDVNSSIIQEMKYFTHDNFVGRPIKGYEKAHCILTQEAALALSAVQQQLHKKNLSLKVFDCYRPQMAVDDFIVWSEDPLDQKMKKQFYPRIDKAHVFDLGYVAKQSGHSRGSTVDLTIIDLSNHRELEMGTHFDFMDELSHALHPAITGKAKQNRLLLRELMQQNGFIPYEKEWWHFTLKDEPYPNTYFNFPVT